VIAQELAKVRVKNDLKALSRLTIMHSRETRAILELSKALRLPPRARYTMERSTNLKSVTPATATRPWNIRGGDDAS